MIPSQRAILRFWSPLAVMWVMMALEQPILSATIARMAAPTRELAAFGLTFSMALLVESPIIMLLTAGAALARGRQSYQQLLRFTTILSAGLTLLHLLVALTPLFALIVERMIGAPADLVEPSRLAFLMMTPWTAAVAYRRLWQGAMIRHGYTDQVGLSNVLRLVATAAVAVGGLVWPILPGAALAGLALSAGVISGAVMAWVWAQPVLRGPLAQQEPPEQQIALPFLLDFYIPLALTSFINFVGRPLLSYGLSRGLLPLESLAVWPVLTALAFLLRSFGFAYQEVTVALLKEEAALPALRRFALILAVVFGGLLLIVALTPLNGLWYGAISGLSPALGDLARLPTLLIVPVAGLSSIVAWQRGVLVQRQRTRPITISVIINLIVLTLVMLAGVELRLASGLAVASLALTLSVIAESLYLARQLRQTAPRPVPLVPIGP